MEADGVTVEINELLWELNQDISKLMDLSQRAKELGERIQRLQTHQFEIASSAAILQNGIPESMRGVVNRYALVVNKLEAFRSVI